MAGVAMFVLPCTLRSPQPWSSVRITTMFGLAKVEDAAVKHAAKVRANMMEHWMRVIRSFSIV